MTPLFDTALYLDTPIARRGAAFSTLTAKLITLIRVCQTRHRTLMAWQDRPPKSSRPLARL